MKHCPRCRIVLGDGSQRCSLCGAPAMDGEPELEPNGQVSPITAFPTERSGLSALAFPDADRSVEEDIDIAETLSSDDRRHIAAELLSVAFGIALVVCLLADLFSEHRIGWSRYTSVGIAAAWLATVIPLLLVKRPWLVFAVLSPSLILLVFLLDAFDGQIRWFLGFGLPITGLFAGIVAGAGAIISATRRKGLNVMGVILTAIAAFGVGLEFIIDLNLFRKPVFDWSVVVAFALVPTAGLLFYLHYRIVDRASLRKLFRL